MEMVVGVMEGVEDRGVGNRIEMDGLKQSC